jgi:hypothetical protein
VLKTATSEVPFSPPALAIFCRSLSGLSIPYAKQLNELIVLLQPLVCQVHPSIMTTLVQTSFEVFIEFSMTIV